MSRGIDLYAIEDRAIRAYMRAAIAAVLTYQITRDHLTRRFRRA